MDVHLPNERTVIYLFASLKCTLPKLIPFPHRIQIGFEPALHVDGIDRDLCPIFRDGGQDDLGRNEHVSFLKFF